MSGTTFFHQFRKDEGDQTRTDSFAPSRGHRLARSSNHSVISSDRPSSTFAAKPILPDDYPKKPQPQASSTRTHRDGNPEGNFIRQQNSAYGSHSNQSPRPSERHPDSIQYNSYDEQRYQHPSYRRSRSPPQTADRYDHPDHGYYRSASPPMSDRPSSYGSLAYPGVDTVEAEAGNILISLANQYTVPPPQMNATSRPQSYDASAARDYDYRRSTENRTMSEVEVAATIQSLSNPQSHQRYPPTPAQSTSSQSTSSKNSSMSIKNLLGDESSATSPIAPSPPQRSVDAQYREYQPYHSSKSGEKDRPFLNLTYSNATKQYDSGTQDVMMVEQRYNATLGTNGSKKLSRRLAPPGSVDEGMSQPTKIPAKDSRSVQKKTTKRKSLEASPQDHPSSKPKMIHHHSSPSMLPYHRHEKGEGPLAAPANISGSLSSGSAFHDAVHPHKGEDRVMDYDRQRSYHRHLPPSDDQPRRVPVKTEDHVEGNMSWNNSVSDKARDYAYRQHPRGRDSPSPPRGHPAEQGKPINIKAYHPSNDRMAGYAGPQPQHHWIGDQNPHEFEGYVQGKSPYDSKTSPMQMPQPSSFGPQSNGVRAEGPSAFNRNHYSKYHTMKQDPKLKRNAMHAYITYMIYTDQAQKRAQQQTITPSSSRESYSGPIGPPPHPAPSRSRSSSVPQSGPNSAPGASYSSYSGAREPREQYQYTGQPLGPSPSMGYNGHPVYDEKRPLSAPAQRSPTSSSSRPSQPVQSPYPSQYPPAPAHQHSRHRTPQQSPRLAPEHSPVTGPHHSSMHPRRPSESDPIPRGPPGAAQAPPATTTLPPLSGPPHHHHHHHSPAHHHHHHYTDVPPNSHAHSHSAPPPHHAPYPWPHSGSQAPYSPPASSQATLAPPPLHSSYSSPSPGSNSAPNGRVPSSSLPPTPQSYPTQHISPSNSLPPPSTLAGRDRDASFAGAGPSALPQSADLSDRGNAASTIINQPLTQYLRPNAGPSGGPRREEADRPPTSAGHPEVHLPPIASTVAPGAPVSSGPARSGYYSR